MRLSIALCALTYLIPTITYAESDYFKQKQEHLAKIEHLEATLNDIRQGKIKGKAFNEPLTKDGLIEDGLTALGYLLRHPLNVPRDEELDYSHTYYSYEKVDDKLIQIILSDPLADINSPCARSSIYPTDIYSYVTVKDAYVKYKSHLQDDSHRLIPYQGDLILPPLFLIKEWENIPRRIKTMQAFLEKGANPNYQDPVYLYTVAHLIAERGHPYPEYDIAVFELLKQYNANLNLQNLFGDTPLHIAAQIANYKKIHALLSLGADQTIKNKEKQTPEERFMAYNGYEPDKTCCKYSEKDYKMDQFTILFQIHRTLRPDNYATSQDYESYKAIADAFVIAFDWNKNPEPLLNILSNPTQRQFFVSKIKDRTLLERTCRLSTKILEESFGGKFRQNWRNFLQTIQEIDKELSLDL